MSPTLPRDDPERRCRHCGFHAAATDDRWNPTRQPGPLVVYECPGCGHVVDVGPPA